MQIDEAGYAPAVCEVLARLRWSESRMGLVSPRAVDPEIQTLLRGLKPVLAGNARCPEGALAGLWLFAGGWQQAHEIAQDLESAEGSYWHAIIHRQEPDAWNAGYWLRRTGVHPIHEALRREAARCAAVQAGAGWPARVSWDGAAFVEYCEQARKRGGSEAERLAIEIQHSEWQLLFAWCAGPAQR